MMTHEDALNVILSHNCHNVDSTEEGIQSWKLEGHCSMVTIVAKLVSKDPDHAVREQRYKYEIIRVTVE
jgi:hypothetical protein